MQQYSNLRDPRHPRPRFRRIEVNMPLQPCHQQRWCAPRRSTSNISSQDAGHREPASRHHTKVGDLLLQAPPQAKPARVLPQYDERSHSTSLDRQPVHGGADATGQSAIANDATAPAHRRGNPGESLHGGPTLPEPAIPPVTVGHEREPIRQGPAPIRVSNPPEAVTRLLDGRHHLERFAMEQAGVLTPPRPHEVGDPACARHGKRRGWATGAGKSWPSGADGLHRRLLPPARRGCRRQVRTPDRPAGTRRNNPASWRRGNAIGHRHLGDEPSRGLTGTATSGVTRNSQYHSLPNRVIANHAVPRGQRHAELLVLAPAALLILQSILSPRGCGVNGPAAR
jgi:hypothetical protein